MDQADSFQQTDPCETPAPGRPPALTDSDLLTMDILGEMRGCHGDRAIWRYFHSHWRRWFPTLPSYKTFARQCTNPCWIKQRILFPASDTVHIIDGIPMPGCHTALIDHRILAQRSRMRVRNHV